jgi:hypothetical protein
VGEQLGDQEAPNTAGIIVFANPSASLPPGATAPQNVDTVVARNTVADQFYGIWSAGNDAPAVFGNRIWVSASGVPISPPSAARHG